MGKLLRLLLGRRQLQMNMTYTEEPVRKVRYIVGRNPNFTVYPKADEFHSDSNRRFFTSKTELLTFITTQLV